MATETTTTTTRRRKMTTRRRRKTMVKMMIMTTTKTMAATMTVTKTTTTTTMMMIMIHHHFFAQYCDGPQDAALKRYFHTMFSHKTTTTTTKPTTLGTSSPNAGLSLFVKKKSLRETKASLSSCLHQELHIYLVIFNWKQCWQAVTVGTLSVSHFFFYRLRRDRH